jgi:hypothetical protein
MLTLVHRAFVYAVVSHARVAPPRRASTRCSVSPACKLYSDAVLSSVLEVSRSAIFHHTRASREVFLYICLPPWMRRCWTGGMPSFSSTFSLICET